MLEVYMQNEKQREIDKVHEKLKNFQKKKLMNRQKAHTQENVRSNMQILIEEK